MKTNTLKTLAAGIVASVLLLTSCGKDGATGPAGATGPQGVAGYNGTNGSANVSVSDYVTTVTSWSVTTPNTNYYTYFTVPALTQKVQDSGAVQVFVNINGNTSPSIWTNMPYTFNTTPVYIMNYNTQANYVTIQWVDNTNGSTVGSDPCTTLGLSFISFKVVTIPPAARRANPNVNIHDFEAIKKAFKL